MDELPAKPRRRKWFQFHLSTLIVLHLVAAGLVWLNLREPDPLLPKGFHYLDNERFAAKLEPCYGWPFKDRLELDFSKYPSDGSEGAVRFVEYVEKGSQRDYRIVCLNVLIGLAILTIVGLLCERSLRYLEARREGSSTH